MTFGAASIRLEVVSFIVQETKVPPCPLTALFEGSCSYSSRHQAASLAVEFQQLLFFWSLVWEHCFALCDFCQDG